MGPVDEGGGHGLYGEPTQKKANIGSNREGIVCLSVLRGIPYIMGQGGSEQLAAAGFKWALLWTIQAAPDSRILHQLAFHAWADVSQDCWLPCCLLWAVT